MEMLYLFSFLITEKSLFKESQGGQVVKREGSVREKNEELLRARKPEASAKMTWV